VDTAQLGDEGTQGIFPVALRLVKPTVSDFSFGVLGALLDSVVCFNYVSALLLCMVSAHGMLRDPWIHFHFISPAFISFEISHCLILDSLKEKGENGAARNDV
jgi:hypothetical protein